MLNRVQKAAYELIQADARFLYTLTVIHRKAKNIIVQIIEVLAIFKMELVLDRKWNNL